MKSAKLNNNEIIDVFYLFIQSDDDDDLYSSITIARNSVLAKRKEQKINSDEFVANTLKKADEEKEKNKSTNEEGKVFSSVTEFTRRLGVYLK